MILKEYNIESTKVKFYDDYIAKNTDVQKECIDNLIINLIKKHFYFTIPKEKE